MGGYVGACGGACACMCVGVRVPSSSLSVTVCALVPVRTEIGMGICCRHLLICLGAAVNQQGVGALGVREVLVPRCMWWAWLWLCVCVRACVCVCVRVCTYVCEVEGVSAWAACE